MNNISIHSPKQTFFLEFDAYLYECDYLVILKFCIISHIE